MAWLKDNPIQLGNKLFNIILGMVAAATAKSLQRRSKERD